MLLLDQRKSLLGYVKVAAVLLIFFGVESRRKKLLLASGLLAEDVLALSDVLIVRERDRRYFIVSIPIMLVCEMIFSQFRQYQYVTICLWYRVHQ